MLTIGSRAGARSVQTSQEAAAVCRVPESYTLPYKHLDSNRQEFAGMLAALDEQVGRLEDGFAAKGLWDQTLTVFSADNGGPVGSRDGKPWGSSCATGTQNWPLRGGKGTYGRTALFASRPTSTSSQRAVDLSAGTMYEGGMRSTAWVHGAMLAHKGQVLKGLMHVVDCALLSNARWLHSQRFSHRPLGRRGSDVRGGCRRRGQAAARAAAGWGLAVGDAHPGRPAVRPYRCAPGDRTTLLISCFRICADTAIFSPHRSTSEAMAATRRRRRATCSAWASLWARRGSTSSATAAAGCRTIGTDHSSKERRRKAVSRVRAALLCLRNRYPDGLPYTKGCVNQ